jgi:hypothetical protein
MTNMGVPSPAPLLVLLPLVLILSSLSVVGLSIQEAHAQISTNKTTGWTRFWEEAPTTLSSNYVLRVVWIECDIPEDDVGGDKTVVKMFGADYYQWGPQSMGADETKSIDWGVDFPRPPRITIEVWDYDAGWWPDPHDLIGRHQVPYRLTPTNGIDYYTFDWEGAKYTLAVQVLPHRR